MRVLKALKTPVMLLVLLAFFGYASYWGYQQLTAPPPAKPVANCVMTDVGAELKPSNVTLQVLNGGTVSGLARQTSTYLRAYGFHVKGYGNTDEYVSQTTIIGNSEDSPEVLLVMGFFPKAVARADGRADHSVDVVIGPRYSQLAKPTTAVPVNGPVCLPAPATTPSASATPSATPKPKATPSATNK